MKAIAAAMVVAVAAIGLAGCDAPPAGPTPLSTTTGGPVTVTWWSGAVDDATEVRWRSMAEEFERLHPNVTVEVTRAGSAADLLPLPVAELITQARAGALLDLTDLTGSDAAALGGAAAALRVDGRQVGLPYAFGIEGFWYRRSLFARAAIVAPPATMAELADAVTRLKAAGVIPIAVDYVDRWPAAHYWQNLALRHCPAEALRGDGFTDPCFLAAGAELAALVATDPFQPGLDAYETIGAAGYLAQGTAGMMLAGPWNLQTVAGLADDPAVVADLGWFPFPAVAGGRGTPGTHLGYVQGLACSVTAPPECVDLLRFVVRASESADLARPYPVELVEARDSAALVQVWLDEAFGPSVGSAMNGAAAEMFVGRASAEDVVTSMRAAG